MQEETIQQLDELYYGPSTLTAELADKINQAAEEKGDWVSLDSF